MSDERWRELGIPRRSFLKRTAAATFVAPVVVSFSLDGIAEAAGQAHGYQCFANQANQSMSNQLFNVLGPCTDMFQAIPEAIANYGSFAAAQVLEQNVVTITLQIAEGQFSNACQSLFNFSQLVQKDATQFKDPTLASRLLGDISVIESDLGCYCTVRP